MKTYKLILPAFLFSFCMSVQTVHAQYVEDFRARTVLEKQYTDVKGSPWLTEDWVPGMVKLGNGSTYKDVPLKYDQVSGELIFRDRSGKTLAFADPVSEFKIIDAQKHERLFRSGFKAVDSNTGQTFYQVLYDGGTILLKDVKKNIIEHRAYNSATAVKSIVETPVYYLIMNGSPVKIKKDKKAILAVLSKTDQLEKYIKDNNLNLKDDQDLAKLITFYDSIKDLT